MIGVLRGGRWSLYIHGGPEAVNASGPSQLNPNEPFFVRCDPSPATTSSAASPVPTVAPTAAPAAAIVPFAPSVGVYYETCDAARPSGAAPVYRGDPGYRAGLDRDNDGVGGE